jgi:hypothetical protein
MPTLYTWGALSFTGAWRPREMEPLQATVNSIHRTYWRPDFTWRFHSTLTGFTARQPEAWDGELTAATTWELSTLVMREVVREWHARRKWQEMARRFPSRHSFIEIW